MYCDVIHSHNFSGEPSKPHKALTVHYNVDYFYELGVFQIVLKKYINKNTLQLR